MTPAIDDRGFDATGMTRRRFAGLGIGALGALALAACGAGDAETHAQSGSLGLYNDNVAWKDGFIAAGKRLKRITDFDFKPKAVAQQDAYAQLVKTSITTKKTADVAKWHEAFPLQDLARTGKLTDLGDTWDAVADKGWLDNSLRSAFTYDKTVYGLPLVQSYWAVFYSKPLFAKAGVQPPRTYEQFLDVAAALKRVGTTPIWTGQGDGWESFVPYTMLLTAQDPSFYEKLTADKASYSDATSRHALELWKTWIESKWVTPADSKLDDAAGLMKSGKLGMLPIGTWYNGTLKKAGLVPGKDYGAFLFPTIDGAQQSVFVESSALVVPTNAPFHDGAMKQMKSWLDPAVQRGWSNFLGDNSANTKVQPVDPVLQEIDAAVRTSGARKLTRYFEASPPNLVNGNIEDLSAFMIDPGKAGSVVSSMTKRATTEWKAWEANR